MTNLLRVSLCHLFLLFFYYLLFHFKDIIQIQIIDLILKNKTKSKSRSTKIKSTTDCFPSLVNFFFFYKILACFGMDHIITITRTMSRISLLYVFYFNARKKNRFATLKKNKKQKNIRSQIKCVVRNSTNQISGIKICW